MASVTKVGSTQTTETGKEPAVVQQGYAERLTSTMFSLRAWKEICDFTIQVGDEGFPVHRIVLVSASNYFYELMKGDNKCMKDGVLQLNDVKARAVRRCIEFMYKGKASVTGDTVFDILSASEKFKLDDLIELCLEFLSANISVGNCFRGKMAFEKRGLSTKAQEMDDFIASKFELLIGTDEFLNMNGNDFGFYIRTSRSDVGLLWQAVKNWVTFDLTKRQQHYPELISSIKNSFGVKFVLDTVWPDPLTTQSKEAKDLITIAVLEDVTALEKSLTADNCFYANEICDISRHGNSGQARSSARHFIAENFDDLSLAEGFLTLSETAVSEIFRSPKTERVSEKLKWYVARKWIHHDMGRRMQFFPTLLSSIKLENMEIEFLQSVVRADDMVQEFDECKDTIMDAFYAIANPGGAIPSSPKSGTAGKTPKTPKMAAHARIAVASQPSPSSVSAKRPLDTEDTADKVKRARKTPGSSPDSPGTHSPKHKPHLAVYDPGTGKLMGLDFEKANWKILAITEFVKGAFQGVVVRRNILYLLKGVELFTLDVTKKTWMKLTSKQEQPSMWSKLLACKNHIYVLQNGRLDVYSIEKDTWVEKKPFVSHGDGFCSCVLSRHIYIMGGLSKPSASNRYRLSVESVTEIAPMITKRAHAAATTMDGRVYVLGGTIDATVLSSECYDPTTKVWTMVRPMQKNSSKFCACAYDEKIYAVGRKSLCTRALDPVEVYERAEDGYKWRIFSPAPMRVSEYSSACVLKVLCQ